MRGDDRTGGVGGRPADRGAGLRLSDAPSEPGDAADIAGFLRTHPPFDALAQDDVERLAVAAQTEHHPKGSVIFAEGEGPVEHLRVVQRGAVEIIHQDKVLDLLGEGELLGHASMLSGLPTGVEARAAEVTLCLRIPASLATAVLAGTGGMRSLSRSLLETPSGNLHPAPRDPAVQAVGSLIRREPVLCAPETAIREAAQRMSAAPASSVVVERGDGTVGILTDRDLRSRVVAAGLPLDAPVSSVMSAPAYTCGPDRLAGEILLEMLDRGFRHVPVLSATGVVLGVIEDVDLVAVQTRSSFFLRQAIGRAQSVEELVIAARELHPAVIAMHDARVAASTIAAVYAVFVDALTRRLIERAVAETGEPAAPFAWLGLGSQARRETVPSSDVDSAIVWFGELDKKLARPPLQALAKRVMTGLEACGLRADEHGVSATDERFVRSLASWQRAGKAWIADPALKKALVLASVLIDSRPVWGIHTGTPVADTFRLAPGNPQMLRLLARYALSHRPPTGFLRGLVVEHTGEHRGRLDLKRGGITPIVDLARWAGVAAGVTCASTAERLRAAAAAGTLTPVDARTLEDAHELISSLRLEHQVAQLRAGAEPDDHVDPSRLSPVTRSYLRESFRAVASVQKRVAAELQTGGA
jgi:CBS domain-containing protein